VFTDFTVSDLTICLHNLQLGAPQVVALILVGVALIEGLLLLVD